MHGSPAPSPGSWVMGAGIKPWVPAFVHLPHVLGVFSPCPRKAFVQGKQSSGQWAEQRPQAVPTSHLCPQQLPRRPVGVLRSCQFGG